MSASNLKLDIDAEDLEFNDHIAIAEGVKDILSDVEIEITGATTARAHWTLISEPGFYLSANPNGVPGETLEQISAGAWETFRVAHVAVSEGKDIATLDMRRRRIEALRKIVRRIGTELKSVTLDVPGREPITLNAATDQPSSSPGEDRYEEVATYDGIVDLLNLRPPSPFFALRENNTQRIIKVYYADDRLEEVRAAAGRTAEITGLTRFRNDGTPVSMRQIEAIFVYPDSPPDVGRFAGSIPDLIGTTPLDQYLEEIRGTNDG